MGAVFLSTSILPKKRKNLQKFLTKGTAILLVQIEYNLECVFPIGYYHKGAFYVTSEIFLCMVGLKTPIQSCHSPDKCSLCSFTMYAANHTSSC